MTQAPGPATTDLVSAFERGEEEELVVGGGDMYTQRDEHMGQSDTHTIIHIYAYTVCAAAVVAVVVAVVACSSSVQ
jgi:hypothetical protein